MSVPANAAQTNDIVFSHAHFAGHELVLFVRDERAGLRGIIAVHSTRRGPALGGCRIWPYGDEQAALADVLRLSEGMTLKGAAADIPFGGGKMVVIARPEDKNPELLRAIGTAIDRLGGLYITGEDVGTGTDDMLKIGQATAHVCGRPESEGGSGDPSPSTALGCFEGIKAAVATRLGRNDLDGTSVAVQGLGNVGYRLCRHLHAAGARLYVSDIRPDMVAKAVSEMGAHALPPDIVVTAAVDVLTPCALSNAVNQETVKTIRATIVAGAANNQLESPAMADQLRDRQILYAPDFVINGGGMIQFAGERFGWSEVETGQRVRGIADTLLTIFKDAERDGLSTLVAAERLARARIETGA